MDWQTDRRSLFGYLEYLATSTEKRRAGNSVRQAAVAGQELVAADLELQANSQVCQLVAVVLQEPVAAPELADEE
jgi:hypothetical protein